MIDTKGAVSGGCSCKHVTVNKESSCCDQIASVKTSDNMLPWVTREIESFIGKIPQVSTTLTLRDRLGAWKARWGIRRMDYRIQPGLYAVGNPSVDSLVVVSANYKMSFDLIRCKLAGFNLWLLVLDTKGINIWCAAGKGTFGTEELVKRISAVNLAGLITHRTLILPQLSAPGVSAHQVLKLSGFKVMYGPVRAEDIPEYLAAGLKATAAMREVHFQMLDRLMLTPFELVSTFKPSLIFLLGLFFINLAVGSGTSILSIVKHTATDFIPFGGAVLVGAVVVPLLLPYIPGRAFAWKGWLMGLLWAGVYGGFISKGSGWSDALGYFLVLPPIVSYLALNFTGCSTYTSLSGVEKEMKVAVPAQVISVVGGLVLMVSRLFFGF